MSEENCKYHIFKYNQAFRLEFGDFLPEFQLNYTTFGSLNAQKDNVVWVCHAFTGNPNPSEWWDGLIGNDKLFNPKEHFIVCANIIGSHYGSTNPLSPNPLSDDQAPYFHNFPFISIRDVVRTMDLLRIDLGISKIKVLLGGSLGGQQALEWSIICPDLIENMILFSTNAVHSPWGIAFNESQRMAIELDPSWKTSTPTSGMSGMAVARSIALLSYRNYTLYDRTQARSEGQVDFFRASTYQQYQGEKLQKRFNAYSYWTLTKMFDSHDVGRNRGGLEKALQQVQAKTLVIGISSDLLFPPEEQEFIAKNIPNARYELIDSMYGHDGFLIEFVVLSDKIKNFLD